MAPKRLISGENKPKRKNVVTTIERKKEIIDKYEKGARITDLAAEYRMARSTVATILKNKEAIKGADVAMGVKKQLKRPAAVEEMEKLLMVWINERQMPGDSMSEGIIYAKARRLHGDLICDTTSDSSEDFKAGKGWFGNFKKRTGIHSVVRHGEAASADKVAAKKFVPEFKKFVDKERLSPQQVFNCDEIGLFWKKLPNRTYITKEEKCLPGYKPMKDRLTLLLCANASGDCKIKPLLVYHSENTRPFKKNVKTYLIEKNLPLKALLLMDNAPARPPGVEEELVQESAVVDDIVSLGRAIGIEVDSDDVKELVQAHSEDLTTDELCQLHQEQLQEVTEELSSGEEEGNSKESLHCRDQEVFAAVDRVGKLFGEVPP
ncbi:tigger transposable element-derived protein 1-like [Eriocheir sinensis]|uniref:tigger transposable element-derived protein 1-like n=1 Tax=Eriocheir sinensis TaxID=95602 RepID=UPI0021C75E97|nr:tigger transposable element-derived protein 1-like [Eriocheir sinensis]